MIYYKIVSTGSKGNAVIINDYMLIDCGVPYSKLADYADNLKIVMLTHIHSDHFNPATLRRLARKRPTLRFACPEWLSVQLIGAGVPKRQIDIVKPGGVYDYGKFKISLVRLYHNVPNCGYRVYFGDEKLIYATDTNTMAGITAQNYDLYMIEANYTTAEIEERIAQKQRAGEYAYETQVLRNHLSFEAAQQWLADNIGPEGRYVFLHGHEERDKNDNFRQDKPKKESEECQK